MKYPLRTFSHSDNDIEFFCINSLSEVFRPVNPALPPYIYAQFSSQRLVRQAFHGTWFQSFLLLSVRSTLCETIYGLCIADFTVTEEIPLPKTLHREGDFFCLSLHRLCSVLHIFIKINYFMVIF